MLFTLAMLAVYRIGVFVTAPGVDRTAMRQFVASQKGLLGFFNMFSGGALENMSIFALGIMPYISASIIMQLMGMVYAPVAEMRKEGEQGRRKLDQYTRYGTIGISIFQSYGIARMLEGLSQSGGADGVVTHPGLAFELMTVITLTTGTAFLMWIGEQITERGVSNGISLLIFASIITAFPPAVMNYLAQNEGNIQPLTVAAFLVLCVLLVATVAFFENARRQIPIVYSRRQVGRRVYGGQTAHLPIRVNIAGTIPPIFASSLIMFPTTRRELGRPRRRLPTGDDHEWRVDVQHLLRDPDHLLLLLLHQRHVPTGGRCGEPKEAAGQYSRHTSGPANRRIHRNGQTSGDDRGLALRGGGVRDPVHHGRYFQGADDVRRYISDDRCRCCARYRSPARGPSDHPKLRRPDRPRRRARSRSAIAGIIRGGWQ